MGRKATEMSRAREKVVVGGGEVGRRIQRRKTNVEEVLSHASLQIVPAPLHACPSPACPVWEGTHTHGRRRFTATLSHVSLTLMVLQVLSMVFTRKFQAENCQLDELSQPMPPRPICLSLLSPLSPVCLQPNACRLFSCLGHKHV